MIASRTKSKCDDLKAKLEGKTTTKIETAALDADKVEEVIALIESYKPEAVLNDEMIAVAAVFLLNQSWYVNRCQSLLDHLAWANPGFQARTLLGGEVVDETMPHP